MTVFLTFVGVFLAFGWLTYRMIRYTNDSVGAGSPLTKLVVYRYSEWDFLKWRQTPFILFIALVLVWPCWILITVLNTATSPWPYVLTLFIFAVCAGSFYLLYTLLQLERKFWTLIANTELTLDPATKSIKVTRIGRSTLLTANSVALIESHSTAQGKFTYHHFRFIDHDGHDTFFFDYGKGLGFAIETYFKGVPIQWIEHKFPFDSVQIT